MFRFLKDGSIRLTPKPKPELFELHSLIGDHPTEKKMEAAVARCKVGEPLLKEGNHHYLAMHRIKIKIFNVDERAVEAQANGRFEDTRDENMCFYLTKTNAEGGTHMPFVIIVSEKMMEIFSLETENHLEKLVPDFRHNEVYVKILKRMVKLYKESKRIFKETPDETEAGKHARVWTYQTTTSK